MAEGQSAYKAVAINRDVDRITGIEILGNIVARNALNDVKVRVIGGKGGSDQS